MESSNSVVLKWSIAVAIVFLLAVIAGLQIEGRIKQWREEEAQKKAFSEAMVEIQKESQKNEAELHAMERQLENDLNRLKGSIR